MFDNFLTLKRKINKLGRLKTASTPRRARSIKISENQITLKDESIPYTLRLNPRSKSIRLAIHASGEFAVTAPPRVSQKMIEQIVLQKQDWIIEKIEYFKKAADISGAHNTQGPDGIALPPQKTKAQQKVEQKAQYDKLKKTALKIATEKVYQWNTYYNFKFKKISIKNQKTRWGSCSKNGNLNFNYKIALLPEKLADYLVVHELCHLGQFNHSSKFWALVGQTIPDYQIIRKELKGVK